MGLKKRRAPAGDPCRVCGQPVVPGRSVFQSGAVHAKCFVAESERSAREDTIPGTASSDVPGLRTRPPKYMLTPDEQRQHGY